jgi:hypothetical protein
VLARNAVLQRGIARASDDEPALRVERQLAERLIALAQPERGFQFMLARRGSPARRCTIGIRGPLVAFNSCDDGIVQQIGALPGDPAEAVVTAMIELLPPLSRSQDPITSYSLPNALFPTLTDPALTPETDIAQQLINASVPAAAARAFIRACLAPRFQAVVYSLNASVDGYHSHALVLVGDTATDDCWLVDTRESQTVYLQPGTHVAVEAALRRLAGD